MNDVAFLDATELATRIRARELSPVEALAALRERAEELNPRLNAIVTFAPDAEEHAREAERALLRGEEEVGPLHGVPFTIKDTLDTAALRTTRGSLLFADNVPKRDATAVARLRKAGGILLGKTNTPEFALWWESGNRVFGTTSNPWDLSRTSGGSSGGEAAAIAAGLSPLGLGSDLGGSIRLPAAHCGCVGFKPTHGRVPLTGHFPETILRFMHVGPLARSARDAALALSLIAGPDGVDPYVVPVPPPPVGDERSPHQRVGVVAAAGAGFGPVEPEVTAAVLAAADALAAVGCTVEEIELPWLEARDWNLLTMPLYGGEGSVFFDALTAGHEEELHSFLKRRLSAPRPSLADYVAIEAAVDELRRDLTGFFADYDLLLCPVTPAPAPPHEQDEIVIAGRSLPARSLMRTTLPFDLTGSPALAVPVRVGPQGLPLAAQLVGRRFEDEAVLSAGAAFERERGPLPRPPL